MKFLLPWWLSDKESTCQCRRQGFYPWVGKIFCRWKWQSTPVFLPGEYYGQRSLADYIHGISKRIRHRITTEHQWEDIYREATQEFLSLPYKIQVCSSITFHKIYSLGSNFEYRYLLNKAKTFVFCPFKSTVVWSSPSSVNHEVVLNIFHN